MTGLLRRRAPTPAAHAYPGHVLQDVPTRTDPEPWPRRWDWVLAASLFLFTVPQFLSATPMDAVLESGLVAMLLAASVIPRRRYPVATFTVVMAFAFLQIFLGVEPGLGISPNRPFEPTNADVAIAVLLYTVAAYRPRRLSVAALTVSLIACALAILRWAPAHQPYSGVAVLGAAVALGGIALVAWVLGDSVAYRYRRAYAISLEDRAARAEAERDAQARIAAAAERSRELQEQRARVIDESVARLRRIERDLHDGAQVRLAALAMTLGEIKENLAAAEANGNGPGAVPGPGAEDAARTRMLVDAAHRNAKETLTELRDLARGIHPPVLDRGLRAALASLAETSATPVELNVSIQQRPSPAIETIAYFCAAELLANAAKHSQAKHVTIGVSDQDGKLIMTVTDDGTGGAHLAPNGGLAGLRERVRTVDGRLYLESPPGGPTTITIDLPGHA